MTFEAWLAKKGFDLDALTPEQLDGLEAAWRAEQNPAPANPGGGGGQPGAGLNELLARLRADEAREQRITGLVAEAAAANRDRLDELEAIGRQAIAARWTEAQTELALLRACRPAAPSPIGRGGREATAEVVEAALARAAGVQNLERHFGARTLEQADRQFRGGLSIGELVLSMARRNGCPSPSLRGNLAATLQYALTEPRADVGVSNHSLSGILSNLSNKGLRDDFMAVEQAWRMVAVVTSARDFKEFTKYNLVGDLDYDEVPRGGELQSGDLSEETYANQLKQYGKFLAIDRIDFINDDLSAFVQARRRLSRGAATKLNKIFWTEWNNLTNFNTVPFGNYAAGAGTAFSEAALQQAYDLFTAQTDPDGEPLGVMPRQLVVPSSVYIAAKKLMESTTATAGDAEGDANPWAGMFEVVTSTYMASTTLGGLATQWHLTAGPAELPCIEVAFLNGVEAPTVNDVQQSANRLGLVLQAFLDFGVRRQERRGRVTMKGAA